MNLSKVKIKGFRNFKNITVNVNPKTLVIGANDIGKTNLIWAIRLLLDRSLNDFQIEPKDSDFYAFEETNSFSIKLFFENVVEDCVVSKLKGRISNDDKLVLAYEAYRDKSSGVKTFKLFAGQSKGELEEIDDRFYRKVLNLKYISSRRDFNSFINREKRNLFEIAKDNRSDDELKKDEELYSEIKCDLESIDSKIPKLNFISEATVTINEELKKLSLHHAKEKVVFDTSTSNIDSFINSVSIATNNNEENVVIGGDGRLNQIYLALWASKNELSKENLKEVSIVCIEEPEAHLHPHQQRKLAEYLNSRIFGQVILTSHSPQIASEYNPNSIIRLFSKDKQTKVASNGCSRIIDDAFEDFGYRLSIIPAEAFFSDVVLLIEGPSEDLFYKTLSRQIGIDLDRLNISVLMVDGIGFSTYIQILNAMEIDWVLRTDNDIIKIPKKEEYRFAGVQRCINFYRKYFNSNQETEEILNKNEALLKGFKSQNPPEVNRKGSEKLIADLEEYNMFISTVDLENDIFNSELKQDLIDYFEDLEVDDILPAMQKRKASFMYSFLKSRKDKLGILKGKDIAKPLVACQKIVLKKTYETD
ncbi:AAA family ATPase [uncultured Zobellia sp.]|uniref:ATP-dependent nuclease n=1 Tax=uncultured Zobellia sp. TaxID=255433 RepID=UPI0025986E97|nr:AAA family ATPase [uncultured Zobellia sp.]